MPYSFRNRDKIRAPARLDDSEDEHRKASYREPDLDEEMYRVSPPKHARVKYRGPVTQFNPNLPPAAFPTLNDSQQAHHRQPLAIANDILSSDGEGDKHPVDSNLTAGRLPRRSVNYDSEIHEKTRFCRGVTCKVSLTASLIGKPIVGGHAGNRCNGRTSHLPPESSSSSVTTSNDTSFATMIPHSNRRSRTTMRKHSSFSRGFKPHHDGTKGSILEDNMRRMKAAGELSADDRIVLEMLTSEDEDEYDVPQQPSHVSHLPYDLLGDFSAFTIIPPTLSFFGSRSYISWKLKLIEPKVCWNDLPIALKLQLYDVISYAYPSEEATQKLRLNNTFVEELTDAVLDRDERIHRESQKGSMHRREVHDRLLRGARISREKFREIMDLGLFQNVREGDESYDHGYLSQVAEVKKARRYLTQCHLDPKLLDGAWASIPQANAITLGLMKGNESSIAANAVARPNKPDRSDPYDASDDLSSRSPSRIKRPLQVQHSLSRQSSGFIRPSVELDDTMVHLPPTENFIHRPDIVRLGQIKVKKAGIGADRAAIDGQVRAAAGTKGVVESGAAVSAHRKQQRVHGCGPPVVRTTAEKARPSNAPTEVKRRASVDSETSFPNDKRRPGARQPRLTKKAVDAEIQSSATTHKQKRVSGGSSKGDTASAVAVHSRRAAEEDGSSCNGALIRDDSAIDLTADDEQESHGSRAK